MTLTAELNSPAGSNETELRAAVRAFLDRERDAGRFTPRPDSWMSGFDPDFSRRLAERGWIGMTIPREYGGPGRSAVERYAVVEELLAAGAPVAAHWIADRQMAAAILRYGTEDQKRRYLPGIAQAHEFFAIGMSEPEAGSDLSALRTRAVPTATGWTLTGTKLWSTGAHVATAMVVLARTQPRGADRHAGLTQFIVDLPHPRVRINPIRSLDGQHHFNEVVFDDAELAPDAQLGAQGDGWAQVSTELTHERSGPERVLSTMPLLAHWAPAAVASTDPHARREFGRLVGRLATLRHLSREVAELLAAGGRPELEAALVKDAGTRFEGDVVATIRSLRSSVPLDADSAALLAEGIVRAPAFTLRGGTNEILRSMTARGLGLR